MKFDVGDYIVLTDGGDEFGRPHAYNRIFYTDWLSKYAPEYVTKVSFGSKAFCGMKGTIVKCEEALNISSSGNGDYNNVYLIHTDDDLYFLMLEISLKRAYSKGR